MIKIFNMTEQDRKIKVTYSVNNVKAHTTYLKSRGYISSTLNLDNLYSIIGTYFLYQNLGNREMEHIYLDYDNDGGFKINFLLMLLFCEHDTNLEKPLFWELVHHGWNLNYTLPCSYGNKTAANIFHIYMQNGGATWIVTNLKKLVQNSLDFVNSSCRPVNNKEGKSLFDLIMSNFSVKYQVSIIFHLSINSLVLQDENNLNKMLLLLAMIFKQELYIMNEKEATAKFSELLNENLFVLDILLQQVKGLLQLVDYMYTIVINDVLFKKHGFVSDRVTPMQIYSIMCEFEEKLLKIKTDKIKPSKYKEEKKIEDVSFNDFFRIYSGIDWGEDPTLDMASAPVFALAQEQQSRLNINVPNYSAYFINSDLLT